MAAHIVDYLCLAAAFILPIITVLLWNVRGVVLGTLIHWGALILTGKLLALFDTAREASVLDHVWILFGWISGLAYCFIIFGAKRLILALMKA